MLVRRPSSLLVPRLSPARRTTTRIAHLRERVIHIKSPLIRCIDDSISAFALLSAPAMLPVVSKIRTSRRRASRSAVPRRSRPTATERTVHRNRAHAHPPPLSCPIDHNAPPATTCECAYLASACAAPVHRSAHTPPLPHLHPSTTPISSSFAPLNPRASQLPLPHPVVISHGRRRGRHRAGRLALGGHDPLVPVVRGAQARCSRSHAASSRAPSRIAVASRNWRSISPESTRRPGSPARRPGPRP